MKAEHFLLTLAAMGTFTVALLILKDGDERSKVGRLR